MKIESQLSGTMGAMIVALVVVNSAAGQETIVNPVRGGGIETNNTPMIHADIFYDAAAKKLSTVLDTSAGRPMLRALPTGYAFDLQSKYRVISGKAYNFQYAWNPGGIISLPAGSAVWIECLQTTPGLETYDGPGNKNENPPRPYTPIFGTAGSPKAWKWYGRMAHNTYAIRNPTTNLITAEYRLFIADAQTGSREAYADFPETTMTLAWDIDPPVWVSPFLAGAQAEGNMIHIDVLYDESQRKIVTRVDDSEGVPILRPLAAGQAFDPGKKFAVVNQRSYNSQYGWNIGSTFTLPSGGAFWIEQIGATPGLEVYEAIHTTAGSYNPIFGTSESSAKWKWSGLMMHNCYAVLNPCRERYVAEYRVYVGDAVTGSREAFSDVGDSTVRLLWNTWLCAFPPELKIERIALREDSSATADFNGEFGRMFSLEWSPSVGSSNQWQRVAGPVPGTNAVQQLRHTAVTNAAGFYRILSEAL